MYRRADRLIRLPMGHRGCEGEIVRVPYSYWLLLEIRTIPTFWKEAKVQQPETSVLVDSDFFISAKAR